MGSPRGSARDEQDEWHDALADSLVDQQKVVPTPVRAARTFANCCCISQDERTLIVTIILFSIIVLSQFVGAYVSRSRALLIDAGSMLIDVATYFINLWGLCAPTRSKRTADIHEVLVSGASLLALWAITLVGVGQAVETLRESGFSELNEPESRGDGEGVDGRIVLFFACLGILFDILALGQFVGSWREAQRARAAIEATPVQERLSLASCCACVCGAALELNMSSALTHVLADTLRSLTTLVESLLILSCGLNSEAIDGLAALCVAMAIIATSLGTTRRWVSMCFRIACSPADDVSDPELESNANGGKGQHARTLAARAPNGNAMQL